MSFVGAKPPPCIKLGQPTYNSAQLSGPVFGERRLRVIRADSAVFSIGPVYPRSPTDARVSSVGSSVPMHKVAALQPAARGKRREAGSQLRGRP